MLSLIPNSDIAHLYVCVIVALIKGKLTGSTNGCLRIVYNDKQSTFKKLLEKDSLVSVHERSLQILATFSNNFSPLNMNKIFEVRN